MFGIETLTFNTAVFTLLSAAVGEKSSDDTVLEIENRLFHNSKTEAIVKKKEVEIFYLYGMC